MRWQGESVKGSCEALRVSRSGYYRKKALGNRSSELDGEHSRWQQRALGNYYPYLVVECAMGQGEGGREETAEGGSFCAGYEGG